TVVMGASFRSVDQVLALAGCDRLTISPELLEQLDSSTDTVERKLMPPKREQRTHAPVTAERFAADLAAAAMASEKLAEGIAAFARDLDALRNDIAARLGALPAPPPRRPPGRGGLRASGARLQSGQATPVPPRPQ